MLSQLTHLLRGLITALLYFVNTVLWFIPIIFLGLLKLFIPIAAWRTLCNRGLDRAASGWISVNQLIQQTMIRTAIVVSGDHQGSLDEWYLVIANHQSWVDILVIQQLFNGKIPFLKFFLKKELIWIPFLGLAWWALDFPFMRRYSRAFLEKNPHLKGKDIATTRRACAKFRYNPVSIMNFVEGTRFTPKKHQQQQSPYQHLLKARAGGIAFTLAAMGDQLTQLVDVTIAYPAGIPTFWDFISGRVKTIKVHIHMLPLDPALSGDYSNDPHFQQQFQQWLNQIWHEKDRRLTQLLSQEDTRCNDKDRR